MNRYICIHGHFYQPPRENPWLEEVELEDSAYPYHDWNERITAECYSPNSSSRILDADGRIIDIVNNYARISFNFAPTLLSWMERHKPEVYRLILDADRLSMEHFSGHGAAIAQVYNHVIMPLASSRDKRTQVIWGIRAFLYHFGRKPEGMWLAETAVDLETLDIMAEQGIQFTILAPQQAQNVRRIGEDEWTDATEEKIDPRMPYLCHLPSGRTIAIFFHVGSIVRDIAFGNLLDNGEVFADRLHSTFIDSDDPQIVHIATDGETYGHHHRYGDMALAYCLYHIESNNLATITIYGEFLERHPPTHEVELHENSSWSCTHGIERWRSSCGCGSEIHRGWNQDWRAPLRGAMDWLRDTIAIIYEEEMERFTDDPWQARDEYVDLILERSQKNTKHFFSGHMAPSLSEEEKIKVLKILEMQRHAMLMYTSCGWFFNEISRIETVQVLQYAARAMQLAREVSGVELETAYINILERAPSNIVDFANGGNVYELFVKPAVVDLFRVGGHYAISSLFEDHQESTDIYSYTAQSEVYDRIDAGVQRLAIGRSLVRSETTREEKRISFVVLYFGDHNTNGGVREYAGDEPFTTMHREVKEAFVKGDIPEVIRLMDIHFETHNYSLWHLFKDEKRKVLEQIMKHKMEEIEALFRQIYENNYSFMLVLKDMLIPLPRALSVAGEYIVNSDFIRVLESDDLDIERLDTLIGEVKKWSLELDDPFLTFVANRKIEVLMDRFSKTPYDIQLLETIDTTFEKLNTLGLDLDLRKAQNIYFSVGRDFYQEMAERAERGDKDIQKWVQSFNRLQGCLHVKIT